MTQVTCSCCGVPFDYNITCPYCPQGDDPTGKKWAFHGWHTHDKIPPGLNPKPTPPPGQMPDPP